MKTIVLAALLSVASSAFAQSTDPGAIHEGTRVKIRTATIHAAVGSVAASTADSIVLVDEKGARLGIARKDLTQTYVSNGRTALQGTKRGVIWGAGFGALGAAMMTGDPCNGSSNRAACKELHKNESRVAYAAAAFGTMALMGAGIGALVKAEEWNEAGAQSRLTVKPSGLGFTLAVNFR